MEESETHLRGASARRTQGSSASLRGETRPGGGGSRGELSEGLFEEEGQTRSEGRAQEGIIGVGEGVQHGVGEWQSGCKMRPDH